MPACVYFIYWLFKRAQTCLNSTALFIRWLFILTLLLFIFFVFSTAAWVLVCLSKDHINLTSNTPPGDQGEFEEDVDHSGCSNQPERWREERDGLLSGRWQWDGGAEGWHHSRWGGSLKLKSLKVVAFLIWQHLLELVSIRDLNLPLFCWQVFVTEATSFPSPKSTKSRWNTNMMESALLCWLSPSRIWYCAYLL